MSSVPVLVRGGDISAAWAGAFLELLNRPTGRNSQPIIVSVDLSDPGKLETPEIRAAVDTAIVAINHAGHRPYVESVSNTTSTIFPHTLWSLSRPRPRVELFEFYLTKLLPRIKARNSRNKRGTYFERMLSFRGSNQLAEILEVWDRQMGQGRRPRSSALQVACYDPNRDNRRAVRLGFPCLHQVGFGYAGDELVVHAYYPTEYVFARGYGNYLGLAYLGQFMAHEMKLKLSGLLRVSEQREHLFRNRVNTHFGPVNAEFGPREHCGDLPPVIDSFGACSRAQGTGNR